MAKKNSINSLVPRRISDPVVRAIRVNKFLCECGKTYENFPALYLHFKRVHKIKISTRRSNELREFVETDTLRTFTYFYSKNEKGDMGYKR